MRITIEPETTKRPVWQRLAWFFGLWLGGVVTITIVAGVLRWVLKV